MKRFICAMLTLIMLVGMLPMATANAASNATSGAAITVLKTMVTFKDECYRVADTKEFRIGYGTVCKEKHSLDEVTDELIGEHHKINEATADLRLREQLKEMDKKVNAFASSNSLSLKQNQFDALSVFSYLNGTAWMNGNGVVKTAVVNKAGAFELLNAFLNADIKENYAKILVNMYSNNVYSAKIPGNFAQVTYDPNGGYLAEANAQNYYVAWFDSSVTSKHPTPTKNGYIFMGWYRDGARYASLNSKNAGKTLVANWQPTSATYDNATEKTPAVDFTVTKSQLASATIYDKPDVKAGKNIGTFTADAKIVREFIGKDGSRWGKISGSEQWVLISAGSNGTGSTSNVIGVTVTNSYVNSRKNADLHSAKNGSYSQGTKLYILTTKSADGYLWGQVATSKEDHTPVGWVALMYTNWNAVKDGANNSGSDNSGSAPSTKAIAKAVITFNGFVRVRSDAGTDNRIVGSVANNEVVDVYEIKTVNGHQWGRIDSGWFCMTYAKVTMLGSDANTNKDNVSNEGVQLYSYTGVMTADADAYVSADLNANKTKYSSTLKAKTPVNISGIKVDSNKVTWVKVSWRVDTDGKNGTDTTVYGWVPLDGSKAKSLESEMNLGAESSPVKMYNVKYTTAADQVSVRSYPGSQYKVDFKLDKGVEVQVTEIKLINAEIWGYEIGEHVDEKGQTTKAEGWVNLSSKYFTRGDLPTEPDDSTNTGTGKVAVIVNTDRVNVRKSAALSPTNKIGELVRGTTANILEISSDGKWYNLDIDVDNNPKTGSWVSKDYIEVKEGSANNGSGNGGSSNTPVVSGIGIVANTYGGVNIRNGAGTSYAKVGKFLPGTQVEILEMKNVGSTKWGRTSKGWVCMDYITMLTEDVSYPGVTDPSTPDNSGNGTPVGSYDEIQKTPAVYTGEAIQNGVKVYATTDHHAVDAEDEQSFVIRTLNSGDPVTIYELLAVTERVDVIEGDDGDHGSITETTKTTYWARTDDGYIFNPQDSLELDALDEKVYTLTATKTLNVREDPRVDSTDKGDLKQGDQVKVTALVIERDKVWGRIEFKGEDCWIRLDYMTEGGYYVPETTTPPATEAPKPPVIGDNGNTGDGGFVNNDGGYRYTGKVINTNSVNIRATPSTSAKVTTTLKSGAALVIYETTFADNRAWGRCDAGWIYLYYVDMTPCVEGVVDARVVYNDNTVIYSDVNMTEAVGTYSRQSVIDILEIVGDMVRTDLGWVHTDNLL